MKNNLYRQIIGFLIGTNIYIAFIATFIAFTGLILFHASHLWAITAFVFFTTQSAYNLQRYFKWRKNHLHSFLQTYVPRLQKQWFVLIGISTAGILTGFVFLDITQLALLAVISIPTALYVFAHPRKKSLTGLRYIPFLKTILVAFCWTGLFFVVTYPSHHWAFLKFAWPYWLAVFIQIWQSCILFDLRDLESDRGYLRTFANSLSQNGLFVFWAILFFAIVFLSACYANIIYMIPLYTLVALIHMICIYRKTNGLNFTFLVDGSLVIYAVINYFVFGHHL